MDNPTLLARIAAISAMSLQVVIAQNELYRIEPSSAHGKVLRDRQCRYHMEVDIMLNDLRRDMQEQGSLPV